jgi:hypothetical protein
MIAMSEYKKVRGHYSWWLQKDGVSIALFDINGLISDEQAERNVDDIVSVHVRIAELESIPTGKAPCVKFCEATAFRSEMAKKDRRIEELEDLAGAAKKFIDSHLADPDLSSEMIVNYEAYSDLSSQVIIYDK